MIDRLVSELRDEACRPLLDRLVRRLRRGSPLTGRCVLKGLSPVQREQIGAITGVTPRGRSLTIDLVEWEALVVRTDRIQSLRALVEAAVGPIEDRRVRQRERSAAWARVWEAARRQSGDRPRIAAWLDDPQQRRWLARAVQRDVAQGGELLDQALDLLKRLPVEARPLTQFAAEQLGDAHALDANTKLGRLLERLVAADAALWAEGHGFSRRRLWDSVGLVTDELSTSVLALNLSTTGDGPCDRLLRDHADWGLPCRITFRQLRLHPPALTPAAVKPDGERSYLYVCENPTVVAAAADRHGPRCRPLVCVEGNPNHACLMLLSLIRAAGWTLKYHGDFDWGGLRIANRIHDRFGFEPWRYGAEDHRLVSTAHRPLRPPSCEARWDPWLADAIGACGVAVEEESVLGELLEDLAS